MYGFTGTRRVQLTGGATAVIDGRMLGCRGRTLCCSTAS